jgi:hypothetical protein
VVALQRLLLPLLLLLRRLLTTPLFNVLRLKNVSAVLLLRVVPVRC